MKLLHKHREIPKRVALEEVQEEKKRLAKRIAARLSRGNIAAQFGKIKMEQASDSDFLKTMKHFS